MKMILKVAGTELRNLFYSPVAWFLIIVFMILCGVFFTGSIHQLALMQDMAVRNMPTFKDFQQSLTTMIFLPQTGIINNVLNNLYLFVPLLTMGLISREVNNGTIKLLYSSPIRIRQIVLGKYLAIMIYNLLLLGILVIFMIVGAFSIKMADTGLLFAAGIGFYLLICTFAAIGMFMSSLTNYQIVSAIATFVLLFVLSRIDGLWQQYDFVRELTWFLSMNGRASKMLSGLITTRELIYFLLIIFLFISFTIMKLNGGRQAMPWYRKALRYSSVFLAVMVVGYITSRPGFIGYWDATENKANTIHSKTQQILKDMGDEPLEVTFYVNLLGNGTQRAMPQHRNDFTYTLWEKYVRFKPDTKFNFVLYYDAADDNKQLYKRMPGKTLHEMAAEYARVKQTKLSWWMEPAKIRKMIDLAPEEMRAVMQVKYKGRTAWLRTFDDQRYWPDEEHVAAALKKVLDGTGPKVYHVTGNLERDIYKRGERELESYSIRIANRNALINHGYEFDSVNLDKQDVPADATALVVGDPKTNLSELTLSRLRNYIAKGGNLLLMSEPGKQHVLNPVLQSTGASLMPGTIVEVTKDEMPHMVHPYATHDFGNLVKSMELKTIQQLQQGDTARPLHPGTVGIGFSDSGFQVRHVLVTRGRDAWSKVGKLVTDSAAPVFAAQEGDYKLDSFNVSMALARKVNNKEQRIVITGDADFLSNARPTTRSLGNFYHCWLDYERYPISIIKTPPKDVLLNIGPGATDVFKLLFIWILPAVVLLLSTVMLIRRKRK